VLTAVDFELLEGDSLIQLPTRLRRVVMPLALTPGTVDVEVSVFANRQGRIASAEMAFEATGFDEARAQTHAVLAPLLSRLSFDHEVAMDTVALEITELATESRLLTGRVVGRRVDWVPQESAVRSTPETRSLLSTYREGLNAESPFLRALSFAKVIEGVTLLRRERGAAAAASGGTASDPRGRIPTDLAELDIAEHDLLRKEAFAPYLGKKFTMVIDELRPTIRHAVAHLDPQVSGSSLVADRWSDVRTVESAGEVLGYMARVLLKYEILRAQDSTGEE
jgi:hypothetical protein